MKPILLSFPPSGNHRNKIAVKNGRPVVYRTQKAQEFYTECYYIARQMRQKTIVENCECFVYIQEPNRRKRDIDNILKTTFDALVFAKVLEDDSLVRRLFVEFGPVKKGGGLVIYFKGFEENDSFMKFLKGRFDKC